MAEKEKRTGWMFKSYLTALVEKRVKLGDKMTIWLTSSATNVDNSPWTTMTSIKGANKDFNIQQIGYLFSSQINTKSSLDGSLSDNYYEKIEGYPASAYIFSKECPYNCYVRADWDWNTLAATHEQVALKGRTAKIDPYWSQTYDFSDSYNEEEYGIYNLQLTPFLEDISFLSADKTIMFKTNDMNDSIAGDTVIISDDNVPVAYIPLDKVHNLRQGKFGINWNNDGIFKVK